MTVQVAFVHIPKTAGTSLLYAFRQGFGREAVYTVSKDPNADTRPDEFASAKIPPSARVVAGHVTHKDLWSNADIRTAKPKIFSVIRDPFERLLSLFNYNHAVGIYDQSSRSVESFARMIKHAPPNRQCAFLEREGLSAESVATDNFICALPNLEPALEKMFTAFEIEPPRLHKINVTKDNAEWTLEVDEVPDAIRHQAYEINHRDYDLYQALLQPSRSLAYAVE